MSLRWKSELEVRLGAQHCEVTLVDRSIWSGARQPPTWVRADGAGPVAIHAAIAQLEVPAARLPRRARVVLGDDLMYFCAVDAGSGLAETEPQARAQAEALLAQALDTTTLQIEVSLLPGGRTWLAAAVDIGVLDQALDALLYHRIDASRVSPAVLDDFAAVQQLLPAEVCTLALLREQGASLLGFEHGRLSAVEWAHVDWRERESLFERLGAYAGPPGTWPSSNAAEQSQPPGAHAGRTRFLLPDSPRQEAALGGAARDHGWVMLSARMPAAAAGEVT